MSLTEIEVDRVIKDIVNHKIESTTVGDGEEMSIKDVEALESHLQSLNAGHIEDWWLGEVGEWVASRDFDPDQQFEQLKNSGDVDYGYVAYKYSQPYA